MDKNLLKYNTAMQREWFCGIKGVAFIITERAKRKYFSGIDVSEGVFIACEKPAYFADARYFYALKQKLNKTGITAVLYEGISSIKNYLVQNNVDKVYADFEDLSHAQYLQYKKQGVKLLDGAKKINNALSIKTQKELSYIKKACEITQTAFYKTLPIIKKGVTEEQVKSALEQNMYSLGADGVAFETIIAFGANSAVPHHETGKTELSDNQTVLMDFGCTYNGFCADMTRTLFFGSPNQKFLTAYQAVLEAGTQAQKYIKNGVRASEVHRCAQNKLSEYGLDKYFTHSLGHGLGLRIHEKPSLSGKSDEKLLENMAFTVEPGVYFDGEFGIRIEDTVMITKDGLKRLFTDSKELIIIK